MTNFKIRFLSIIGLLALVTGLVLYWTFDLRMVSYFLSLRLWSVLVVGGLLAIGLYFDGSRLVHMAMLSGEGISLGEALQVVFGNYFLALLTPGSAGGMVAQVIFLRKAGLSGGKASVLVLVRTLLSVSVLIFCLPVVLLYDGGLVTWISKKVLVLAAALIAGAGIGGLFMLQSKHGERLFRWLVRYVAPGSRERLWQVYEDVRNAVALLGRNPRGMLRIAGETFLSLLALYSIVPVLFLGMGAQVDWLTVLGRMVVLNFLLYFAPTPGGTGVAEGGLIVLLGNLFPQSMAGVAAILWRLFAEYIPFSIGLYFTFRVFGYQYFKEKVCLAAEKGGL